MGVYDPAQRHPVFFGERWRRCADVAVGGAVNVDVGPGFSGAGNRGGSAGSKDSPVASGYIWGGRGVKL